MSKVTRREFLELGGKLALLMGIGSSGIPRIVEALEDMAVGQAPVIWLQGQSCSGCSVSLLNAEAPAVAEVLTRYISLKFHSTISTATGHTALKVLNDMVAQGGYVLAVEGAVPDGMPEACKVGEETFGAQLARVAAKAQAVLAIGGCAAFGGIAAAENNLTGAIGVPAYLKKQKLATPVIAVPGCPTHPDWLVGTIAYLLKFGMPALDERGRPKMFFDNLIHERCIYFQDYEQQKFAARFGDEGCLFKLGCVGPNTRADCPKREWNGGTNWCIKQGAPCIGCAAPGFASKASFPLYTPRHAAESAAEAPHGKQQEDDRKRKLEEMIGK